MVVRAILATSLDESFFILRGKMAEEPGPPEEVTDNCFKGLGVNTRKIPMNRDNEVESFYHLAPLQSDVLSKPSLDAIPGHGTAETARHRQAQTCFGARVATDIQSEGPRGYLLTSPHHRTKLPGGAKAIRP